LSCSSSCAVSGDILHSLVLSVLVSFLDTSDEVIALFDDNKCIAVDDDEEDDDEGCPEDEPT
jgi:hypothetical protein